jgi:hypothetical protein
MQRIKIAILAAVLGLGTAFALRFDLPARAEDSSSSSAAEDALHRAQDESQQGQSQGATDQPVQTDDYPYKTKSDDVGGQINDLSTTTQEKPPIGKSPPSEGQAMKPPDEPNANTYDAGDVACHFKPAGGWFQPVQGVYQDDPVFPRVEYDLTGTPQKNPQLEKINVNLYTARLPMIVGRYTVMMGVEKYMEKGEEEFAGDHDTISIRYYSDCQKPKKLFFRFRLEDGGGEQTLWQSPEEKNVYIVGPPYPNGEMKLREVTLVAKDGVPPKSFRMTGNSYFLTADLVDSRKRPVGLAVYVGGPLVTTNPVKVQFVPVVMPTTKGDIDPGSDYHAAVMDLAYASENYIPDYYPLDPDGLPTWTRSTLDLSSIDLTTLPNDPDLPPKEIEANAKFRREVTSSAIASRLGAAGMLANAQRVVAILRGGQLYGQDYERIMGTDNVGSTLSTKVVAIQLSPGIDRKTGKVTSPYEATEIRFKPDGSPPDGKITSDLVDTVAHELVHTMPEKLWSGGKDANHNMQLSCEKNYHNTYDKFAYGERVVIEGNPRNRRREDEVHTVMGQGTSQAVWITQCTYGHLIPVFEMHPDPDLLLVRGVIGDISDDKPTARFDAFYDMKGSVEARPGRIKDWGIVLRDGGGAVLATIPIDPGFFTEENLDRLAAPLFVRIQQVPGTASLEFVKNGKVLASKPVSLAPPSLAIDSAPPGSNFAGATVHVAWHAGSSGDKPLKYSVFYSYNDGDWYNDQLFESDVTKFDVAIDRKFHKHAIKIVVTDGSRSSDQVMRFSTK